MKSVLRTRRTTPRCGISVPFGRPVEPDVYKQYARFIGPTTDGGESPFLSNLTRGRSSEINVGWLARSDELSSSCSRGINSLVTRIARVAVSPIMKRSRSAGYSGSRGM